MRHRLATSPLTGTVTRPFTSLVNWINAGAVTLKEEEVLQLFSATLDNPSVTASTRAALLTTLATYHLNYTKNKQEAVNSMLAAVHQDPRQPGNHVSLAKLALALGNPDLAWRELRESQRLDKLGAWTAETNALEQDLEASVGVRNSQD